MLRNQNIPFFSGDTFKILLQNPELMALPSILALIPKFIFSYPLAALISKLDLIPGFSFRGNFVLSFMLSSFIIDLMLMLNKDKLWQALREDVVIPTEWKISKQELLEYARNIPKVRLMRFLICWVLVPTVDFTTKSAFIDALAMYCSGFLLSIFLDGVWLKIFKLKRPEFLFKEINRTYDLNLNEMMEKERRDSDPYSPGSSAWCARRTRDL